MKKEKETSILGFAMGSLGNNLISGAVGTYLLTFYTDVFGLPVAIAGIIMAVAKVWDAVNDPMIGMIADRRKPGKRGKYRPMMGIFGPLFALFAVLSFCSPELPLVGKICWAVVTYVGYGMLFTCFDVPYWASVNRFPENKKSPAIAVGRSCIMWAMMISTTFYSKLVDLLGNGNPNLGYPLAMLALAAPGAIFMLICYATVHEVDVKEEAVTEKISFTQMFKNLFKILTPQLGLSYIVNMLSTLAIYLGSTLGVYFMVYYIGDSSKIMLYMFSCMLPVAVASLFGGYLQKYISPKKLLCICYIIVAISSCAIWFVDSSSLTLTLICICICSAAGGIANVPIMVLIWDLANQASRQKKVSADATVMSLNSLAIKVAQALASAVISMVLAITGYVANTEQTTRALNGILALRSLIPALLIVIAIVVLMLIRVKNVGGSENAA